MRSNVSASLAHHQSTAGSAANQDVLAGTPVISQSARVTPLQALIEIEGRAAWLIWQVEAGQVSPRDAQEQLGELEADLNRFAGHLPTDLRVQLARLIGSAQSAAMIDDLDAVGSACNQARTALQQHRTAVFA